MKHSFQLSYSWIPLLLISLSTLTWAANKAQSQQNFMEDLALREEFEIGGRKALFYEHAKQNGTPVPFYIVPSDGTFKNPPLHVVLHHAGGSAKQARDREFQAILPLRGKILNTWEVDSAEVLGSQSVHDIAVALGVDPGSTDTSGLRYGRVCILADADSDGAHIATLLCALFVRHFRPLVETGRICVSMPPLYRIDVGKHVAYALDDAEKELALERIKNEKIRGAVNVQRFKGLGEMNPAQLRETTMDASSRRLIELSLDAGNKTDSMLDLLLARKRSPDRKEWLSRRGDQAEVS